MPSRGCLVSKGQPPLLFFSGSQAVGFGAPLRALADPIVASMGRCMSSAYPEWAFRISHTVFHPGAKSHAFCATRQRRILPSGMACRPGGQASIVALV